MNTKNILILFLVFIITIIVYNKHLINQDPVSKTHILITRYKETDMSIVLKPFINTKNTTIFIYNKGDDIPLGIPYNTKNLNIIQIPNLGWDAC